MNSQAPLRQAVAACTLEPKRWGGWFFAMVSPHGFITFTGQVTHASDRTGKVYWIPVGGPIGVVGESDIPVFEATAVLFNTAEALNTMGTGYIHLHAAAARSSALNESLRRLKRGTMH